MIARLRVRDPGMNAKTEIQVNGDMRWVDDIVNRNGRGRDACVKILQEVQTVCGYLPAAALRRVTEKSAITLRQIYGVATFYERFRFKPVGRHQVKVCRGTACHVRGAPLILNAVGTELKLADEEDTTPDGEFTFEKIACFGACALAPVVVVDEQTQGAMTPDKMRRLLRKMSGKEQPSCGKAEKPAHASTR